MVNDSINDQYRRYLGDQYDLGKITSREYHSELRELGMIRHRAICELSRYELEREIELSEHEEC